MKTIKYILYVTIGAGLVACNNSKKENALGYKFSVPIAKEEYAEEIPASVEIPIVQPVQHRQGPVFRKKIRRVEIRDGIKQEFVISPTLDTLLKAKNGTTIKIPANAFVDVNGKPIAGPVKVEVVEAMHPSDILFANLSTTSNGEILQTGGMISIMASYENKPVQLAGEKNLDVNMPAKKHDNGMSLYYGKEESACVNWVDPVKIDSSENNEDGNVVIIANGVEESFTEVDKSAGYSFTIWDINNINDEKYNQISNKLTNMAIGPNKVKLSKDSTFQIEGKKVTLWKTNNMGNNFANNNMNWGAPVQGQNTFQTDTNANYVFAVKKLGWANIDRLYHDPRSQNVNMLTKIQNENEFDNIVITLVLTNENVYLPGYQKTDETFCFSHGDYEPQRLPVGARASIVAIAYKNNVPYYDIKTFNIRERGENVLNLKQGTVEGLKAELTKQI